MSSTTSQVGANIHPIQPGEVMLKISVTTTGAETATHTFSKPFASTPTLVSLNAVGVTSISAHCTAISPTAIAITAVGGALTATAFVQGKV